MVRKHYKRLNKKGSLDDLIFGMGVTVFVAFLILVGFKVVSEFNDGIQDVDIMPQNAKDAASAVESKFPEVVDNSFLLLTIGLSFVALTLAFLVRFHPVFMVFFIILMPVVIFMAAVFSNIYQRAASKAAIADVANQMVFMSHIIEYIPIVIGVMGVILMVVQYNTWRNSS